MGKSVLEAISYLFTVGPYFKWTDADIENPCPEFVRIVTVGADGVGFPSIPVGVVECPTDVVVNARVSSEEVDTQGEGAESEPSGSRPIPVAIVGGRNKRNVVAEVEHIIVLIGEIAKAVA